MTLNGALQIGRSGLVAAQAGIQVAGNNMANAATPGYSRQLVHLSATRGEIIGRNSQVGRGVNLDSITRAVDTALQARHREALAHENARLVDQRFLNAIETLQNELTDTDLSSLLSEFFNSFSELSNNPTDLAVRSVVIEQGASVASRLSRLRSDYGDVRNEVDRGLASSTENINGILDQIEAVNREIVFSEGAGGGEANSLRDQRDGLIAELSTYMEVTVIEQPNGSTDLLVNSTPIFLAGQSRGIELRTETEGDQTVVTVRVEADGTTLSVESGTLGGLLRQRDETVLPAIEKLDTFTEQLIFNVNRLHSQGQGTTGFSSVTGSYSVNDTTSNLNHIDTDLPFDIRNGSFFIQVTHAQSGITTTHEITIDGDADSLDDLIDRINNVVGVPNVTASLGVDNQLVLTASAGYEMSFGEDTSGAVAALGINTFFSGENAADITVNEVLQADPSKLAAGKNNLAGSNDNARAIADLQTTAIDALGGRSLRQYWQDAISDLAVKTDASNAAAESAILVRESIEAQISAVSGVSLDEESINLLTFQRQFQAAARYISVIDETLQVLLSIA